MSKPITKDQYFKNLHEQFLKNEHDLKMDELIFGMRVTDKEGWRIDPTTVKRNKPKKRKKRRKK
jgi:hypothetical protein